MDHLEWSFPLLIAAAGKSVRYGRPKLLETIPGKGMTLIEHVVRICMEGGAGPVLVVSGPENEEPYATLASCLKNVTGAIVVHVVPAPGEMRDSIENGMRFLEKTFERLATKELPGFFGFMPADLPGIDAGFVRRLIQECASSDKSLVRGLTPEGRGLHPVAMRWADRQTFFDLPAEYGPNRLWQMPELSRGEFEYAVEGVRYDLDIPQDWEKFPFLGGPLGD